MGKVANGYNKVNPQIKWDDTWHGNVTVARISSYDDEKTGTYSSTGIPGYRRTANIDIIVLPDKVAVGRVKIVGEDPPSSIRYKRGMAPKQVYGEIDQSVITWANSLKILSEGESAYQIPTKTENKTNGVSQYNVLGKSTTVYNKKGTITGSDVRLRAAPGTKSIVLDYLDRNDVVSILGSQNGWYKVRCFDGQIGWVSSDFCDVE